MKLKWLIVILSAGCLVFAGCSKSSDSPPATGGTAPEVIEPILPLSGSYKSSCSGFIQNSITITDTAYSEDTYAFSGTSGECSTVFSVTPQVSATYTVSYDDGAGTKILRLRFTDGSTRYIALYRSDAGITPSQCGSLTTTFNEQLAYLDAIREPSTAQTAFCHFSEF